MIYTTLCYIEKDDCYLMLHRVKKKNDINHDKWIGIGGKMELGETPEECIIREAFEETGLTLKAPEYRGVLHFCPNRDMEEIIHLYTCDRFSGTLNEACPEGVPKWVPKKDIYFLPLWEGDKIFLKLLADKNQPFFRLTLDYEGDRLVSAILDGKELSI